MLEVYDNIEWESDDGKLKAEKVLEALEVTAIRETMISSSRTGFRIFNTKIPLKSKRQQRPAIFKRMTE